MDVVRRFGRAAVVVATVLSTSVLVLGAQTVSAAPRAAVRSHNSATSTCKLANGIRHVIDITFDNVHFFRDNPNVPSDLELMPHLLDFFEQNGTLLSNNHTPLIAHTADDSLTTYTGLYGDRQGMPISNDYQSYNADGTTDPAGSFAYWTDPVFDTASTPNPGHDTRPSMIYSPTPPATTSPAPPTNQITPAPWVPFTRAGCNVGDVSTANMVLENAGVDIPEVFGTSSPEYQQYLNDPDSFKDAETADYVGVAVHCSQGAGFCADATGVKYGETTPSPTAVADVLPTEPGGYAGFQALFGHRYIAPQLGAGTPDLTRHGYEITNASGNLVDLSGNELDGAFLTGHPGFPGFSSINAAQTLAYMADMQESGVPVTYGYISDLHGNEHIPGLSVCAHAPAALGSGDPCYIAQAQAYDAAFNTFLQRLAKDGITPKNTLFILSSDEGDHEAGANVGRAIQPTPATCDGARVSGLVVTPDVACTYPAGSFGELDANIAGLLATETGNTTPFSLESDTAPEFYLTGQPAASSKVVRKFDHDVAALTASNPYSGNSNETIANYLADPVEMAILHMVNADPARTPTLAMFAKPDYFFFKGGTACSGPCVTQNTGFAWDHGDYAAEIDSNYLALAGPGVAKLGLDGDTSEQGPSSAGPNSGQETVPQVNNPGTWIDETDIRPTLMYLTGLKDDYTSDGRVITQVLTKVSHALRPADVATLGACYKQLNSSVGDFGTSTLMAATAAIESRSTRDATYTSTDATLAQLEQSRDFLAETVKNELAAAEFSNTPINASLAQFQTSSCEFLINEAAGLATSAGSGLVRP